MQEMKCQICDSDIKSDRVDLIVLAGHKFSICHWREGVVDTFVRLKINRSVVNLMWGAGRIGPSDWISTRNFIHDHNITEVLEYGSGLSTELLALEGLKVVTMDIMEQHSRVMKNHFALFRNFNVDVLYYPDSDHLPDLNSLYPDKKWDFIFIDGPQERRREVKHAMEVCSKYISLHDAGCGGKDLLENNSAWEGPKFGMQIWEKME